MTAAGKSESLEYRFVPPRSPAGDGASSIGAPLLVVLHGYGANMDDLFALGADLHPGCAVASPQAPIDLAKLMGGMMPGQTSRAWFHIYPDPADGIRYDEAGALAAVDLVRQFICALAERPDVDPNRVFVLGFSQGAMIAHALTLGSAFLPAEDGTQTRHLAGTIGCSGRMIETLFTDDAAADLPDGYPVFISHGESDVVIPFERGTAIRDWYAGRPVAMTWHSAPSGHGIDPSCHSALKRWMADQVAASTPA